MFYSNLKFGHFALLFCGVGQISALERFSNECRKTKTKVITLANQKGRRQSSKPIKARENVHAGATIGFGLTSDWFKKWRENFEPITE